MALSGDAMPQVNLKVGQTLASAIDKGEAATRAMKGTVGVGADKVKEKSGEAAEVAKQKGNQVR